MNKKLSYLLTIILTMLIVTSVSARDYSSKHKVKPGDVISADVINELFNEIENVTKVIQSSDLVGPWGIVQTTCLNGGPGNCSALTLNGMTNNSDGVTRSRSDTVTFTDDGDGTFSWSQATYSSLVRSGSGNYAGAGNYAIVNGLALFDDTVANPGQFGGYNIRKVSSTRFIMTNYASGSGSFNIIIIDKQSLPPLNPEELTSTISSQEVSLTWLDKSSDEVEFLVFRRDSLTGTFTQVGTTSASGITTFIDTVPSSGTYWYRVKSSNANGASVGTNIVKVIIK